jgi:hypothetical protein
MNLIILLSLTLEVFGTIFIALAVLRVHDIVMHEHKIDTRVEKAMKREQRLAIFGILLILSGYIIDIAILF